jgi:hypothetical protein|tara:strand:- start:5 stop:1048 length:1044 start_codon:yes stop_codon:yes gene_type:complete
MENNIDLLALLNTILLNITEKNLSEKLNISLGTIKRWISLKNIPQSYTFELMKLANININYSNFSFKEKDQFFTPIKTAHYCYSKFLEIINSYNDNEKDYVFIEPSAGNGSFLKILPENRRIGLDIESKNEEIIETDYLKWKPNIDNKYIVIGNPPFGLRGHLALKFINHSYKFADYVCFILPQLFESDGKGVPRKRVKGYNLIYSEKLKSHFEYPNGTNVKIECIFQIWSKYHYNKKYNIKKIDTTIMKIYSLSNGGTPSTIRNKKMLNICNIYIPSTCFGKHIMKYYNSFEELPNKKGYGIVFKKNIEENIKKFKNIDWCDKAYLSTNSAYNIRTTQILNELENF